MQRTRRFDRSARLCLVLWATAGLVSLLAPAASANAAEDSTLDLDAVQKRFHKEQGYWTVQLVLTSSFAAVPMAARQINWATGRACDPDRVSCTGGYDDIADAIFIPFSMINLGLGVPCVLGAKLTLMTLAGELESATSAGVLASQWRHRGNQWGLASGLTAAIGGGGGLVMAAIGGQTVGEIAEFGLVMALVSTVTSLVLLHIALPHAVMADEVERTAGPGEQAARRARGPRLTAVSPLGISGVW